MRLRRVRVTPLLARFLIVEVKNTQFVCVFCFFFFRRNGLCSLKYHRKTILKFLFMYSNFMSLFICSPVLFFVSNGVLLYFSPCWPSAPYATETCEWQRSINLSLSSFFYLSWYIILLDWPSKMHKPWIRLVSTVSCKIDSLVMPG